jgi:hypothetical protein
VFALRVVLPAAVVSDESVVGGKLAGGVASAGVADDGDDAFVSPVEAAWSPVPVLGRLAADRSSGRFAGTRWGVRSLLSGAFAPNGLR